MMTWFLEVVMLILFLINQTSGAVYRNLLINYAHLSIFVIIFFQIYRIHSTKSVYESLTNKMFVNATVSKVKGVTIYLDVLQDFNELYTDVSLVVDLNDKNVYDFDVVRRTIDTCKLFKEPTYEPVIQFLYKLFLNSGNFPTECPIKKVHCRLYTKL